MRKSFVYRLYPNRTQGEILASLLEIARQLYNAALQERRDAWKMQHTSLNYYTQAAELKELRQELPEVALLNFSATQDILRRVDKTFRAFYRRVKTGQKAGYPRFKSRDRFDSITFPVYGDGIKIKGQRLYAQNVGLIKIKLHRVWEGKIKTVTLKRLCGKWYVAFSCAIEPEGLPQCDKAIGIDVGLKHFATTSDGEYIENPRVLREAEEILIKAQQRVARKKRGSNRRRKAVKLLAKHHLKVKRTRRDFAHKISRRLINEYGFIVVEDLRIKNMIQNHHLAKSISDASWGQFINILSAKAEEAGREVILVNPNGTSQICSACGALIPKSLSTRIHSCPYCGLSLERDLNAALNILRLGRSLRLKNREAVCFS